MTQAPPDSRSPETVRDEVVLLDEQGTPIGAADRVTIHGVDTPLHLAFSSYLFNSRGELLISRRALDKVTWGGVWTNSCCGHPRPGEAIEDAVRRRVREELGLTVVELEPGLPDFRYRAVDASGVVENEICPVFVARVAAGDPEPDPTEVAEWAWVDWADFVAAVGAVPRAFSPWSVQQVPELDRSLSLSKGPSDRSRSLSKGPSKGPSLDQSLGAVDRLLAASVEHLAGEWADHVAGIGVDVLPEDLPGWLRRSLFGGGKRVRVAMTHWGFVAAGGAAEQTPDMVRAAAALEALHLFALVHDDVMDESDSRRGRPSAHVEAATWHVRAGAIGPADVFGRNLAILLGDLAHTLADRIAEELPQEMRRTWYELCVELIAGQRGDLTGAAGSRRERAHAEEVARLKSGRYTIQRPLHLGAQAAGASPATIDALLDFGGHLGQAFALRDEYLGVWGHPHQTGKPAGDDLLEAKPTVLLSLARERLTGSAADLLDRLGTPGLTPADVPVLADAMRTAGVDTELDRLIDAEHAAAIAVLDASGLDPAGIAGLREAAAAVAWRTS